MLKISGLFILIALFLIGCDEQKVYEKNLSISNAQWERNEKAIFQFTISDTTSLYNLYLNFRHAGDYPYNNLYLFTKLRSPEGKVARDTAQMIFADKKGRWLGKGIGDIYDYQFKFKEAFMFPRNGEYSVEIEQAMREKTLVNVTDIGIRVEKIKNKN